MRELTEDLKRKISGAFPFNANATIPFTPQFYNDLFEQIEIDKKYKPVFYLKSLPVELKSEASRAVSNWPRQNNKEKQDKFTEKISDLISYFEDKSAVEHIKETSFLTECLLITGELYINKNYDEENKVFNDFIDKCLKECIKNIDIYMAPDFDTKMPFSESLILDLREDVKSQLFIYLLQMSGILPTSLEDNDEANKEALE